MGPAWEWRGQTLLLALKIQPRGSRNEWQPQREGRLGLKLQAPPIDGRANRALIEFLAREFKVPRQRVSILSGETGRLKRVAIEAPQALPDFIPKAGDPPASN